MKKLLLILHLLLAISVSAEANQPLSSFKVVSVYDADTFRVDIDGWPEIVGKSMPIRANGVDAPELRGKCDSEKALAQQAKSFTKNLLDNAQTIELRNIKRGKYFRFIADVYVDGENLADMLIKAKLARHYDGGTRQGWCENVGSS